MSKKNTQEASQPRFVSPPRKYTFICVHEKQNQIQDKVDPNNREKIEETAIGSRKTWITDSYAHIQIKKVKWRQKNCDVITSLSMILYLAFFLYHGIDHHIITPFPP